MEQMTLRSSMDANGNYHMYRDNQALQQTKVTDGQQSMPMLQRNLSMGASQYQCPLHFPTSLPPFCQPFEGDGCSTNTHSHIKDSHHPSLSYTRHASGMVHQNNHHDILQVPRFQVATSSCISPEGLLDIILIVQQKLQQLQAIVELMVRVGDPGGQAQEQQSLAAGVKSIMSQLFAATACLRQQPSDPISGLSQSNEGVDLRFDCLYGNGMDNSVPAVGQESMTSGVQITGIRGVERRIPSFLSDSELPTTQSMEPTLVKSGERKRPFAEVGSQFKEQRSDVLFSEPSNLLGHRNTVTTMDELDVSNEGLRIVCNSNATNGSQEVDDHDFALVSRDDDDDGEGENLPPGSYEVVEMAAAEILAEHTHFCELCGKGFKRDANLRMHMRGHGDEYKTIAALARPDKSSDLLSVIKPRRYSCPFMGCKRNKQHRKFQPLKTILCVKNHYRRSHCPKILTCSKCKNKKFSVVADLKTHEKHCGQDKWQCSCGTTFSRKDKLMGHVNLFAGHVPITSSHEMETISSHSEPPSVSFTTESAEHLEHLGGCKTAPAPLGCRSSLDTAFQCGNNDGSGITDLPILGEEIFMGDEIVQCQQLAVHRRGGEKSFLVDNPQRGAMALLQHCG